MGRVRAYFEDKGLTPVDIVPAFVYARRVDARREARIEKDSRATGGTKNSFSNATTDDADARAPTIDDAGFTR